RERVRLEWNKTRRAANSVCSLSHRTRVYPSSALLSRPKSDRSDFGWERGGVRGYVPSIDLNPLTPTLSPLGRGSRPRTPRQCTSSTNDRALRSVKERACH